MQPQTKRTTKSVKLKIYLADMLFAEITVDGLLHGWFFLNLVLLYY